MHEQLRHIVEVARQSKLTVQVLPMAAAHPGLGGPFMVLKYEGEPDLVYTEQPCSGAFLEDSGAVAATKDTFQRLRKLAFSSEDSVGLIASIADELR